MSNEELKNLSDDDLMDRYAKTLSSEYWSRIDSVGIGHDENNNRVIVVHALDDQIGKLLLPTFEGFRVIVKRAHYRATPQ